MPDLDKLVEELSKLNKNIEEDRKERSKSQNQSQGQSKPSISGKHDKIQTAILMQLNNLLMDLNDKIDQNREELLEELSHKANTPGYYKEDEQNQQKRIETGFPEDIVNFYDVRHTITNALASDPNDFENANYNIEPIYEVLGERYANKIWVANDGNDNLFVRISHGGKTNFSHESRIPPGDVKVFWRVYELRLRSPTASVPYRVSEYQLCCRSGVQTSDNSLSVQSFPILVARGLVPNYREGHRRGRNDNIPFSSTIILSNVTSSTSPSNQPSIAQQMRVVSSSASDTATGIGAQQIEITYLTSPSNVLEPFKRKTEIVTMNGLAAVNTVAKDIFRIDYVRVSRAGVAGVTIGNVFIQSIGGVTFEQINGGALNSGSATHYVEKGFGSMITDFTLGCTTTAGTIFSLVATEIDSSGNYVGDLKFQTEVADGGIPNNLITPIVTLNPDGKEAFFIMAVKGRASSQLASASFSFIDFPL